MDLNVKFTIILTRSGCRERSVFSWGLRSDPRYASGSPPDAIYQVTGVSLDSDHVITGIDTNRTNKKEHFDNFKNLVSSLLLRVR